MTRMTDGARTIHRGQFRLIRLQIVNWGTFRGYKDFPVDERGLLFTGPSGSGKSSLLDALSAVLLPTHDQQFNASADLTARGAKQATRSMADYVRGAWSETHDENDQSQKRYLRGGTATWSAVAATYADGMGATVTAVVIKWFTGTETDSSSLRTMHRIHSGHFTLADLDEWAARGFDTRWLRSTHSAADPQSQEQYLRELTKRIGLGDSKIVLSLLGKAKALKNVGDLNVFIGNNMLDEPDTFHAARKMLAAFTPLNEAYETARRAYAQEKVLHDLPGSWDGYQQSGDTHTLAESLLGTPIEHYIRGVQLRVVQGALDELDASVTKLDEELAAQSERCDRAEGKYKSLDRQFQDQGKALEELQLRLESAQAIAEGCQRSFRMYAGLVGELGKTAPENASAFAELHEQLPQLVAEAGKAIKRLGPQRHDVFATAANTRKQHKEKATELAALGSATSLIPPREQRRREMIAREAAVPVQDLTYAAELIDIVEGEERWRPVAEKMLRSFGLRLLIPERQRGAVTHAIDENNMHGVVEYSVVEAVAATPAQADAGTLAGKLTVDLDHPGGPWLAAQLGKRFTHVCVESTKDLDAHSSAVTLRGTLKAPGNYYRKDDRAELTNPSSYILGANTAGKIAALTDEAEILGRDADKAAATANALDTEYQQYETIVRVGGQLGQYTTWALLDHWSARENVGALEERITQIRTEDEGLRRLERDRDKANEQWKDELEQEAGLKNALKQHTSRQDNLITTLEMEQDKPHGIADEAERAYLDEAFAALEPPDTPEAVPQLRGALRRELEHRRDAASASRDHARAQVKSAVDRFIEQWPDSAPDTGGDLDRCGGDFAALHADIVQRRLPQAMGRFQRMISEDMVPSISVLQRAIENAAHDIERRIEMVNAGLRRVEFNPGRHLQIAFKANPSPDVKEFRAMVDRLLSDAPSVRSDNLKLLAQFQRVQQLMRKFTGTDAEARNWRTNVLDVRTSYIFHGIEQDAGGRVHATHHNTGVNSGGEQEKLGAFCLAAALSYNLADVDSEGRPQFAPLMLDEAFSKSDEDFARQALAAFEDFGFQLIVAAPIRMVGILEPFIGQAVLVDKRILPDGAQSAAASATFSELASHTRRK
jgi:uncharacterized protein YPO0396